MAELSLKQFVPSDVCLKCDGCCRYKAEDSAWRPKTGENDKAQLGVLITGNDVLDAQGYIKTIQSCGEQFCRFLHQSDNTCGIYNKRPFECLLYPFVISRSSHEVRLFVHLSCPYIQDHLSRADYEAHIVYLKGFFQRPETKEFLRRNEGMFHDYSAFAPELLYLFEINL